MIEFDFEKEKIFLSSVCEVITRKRQQLSANICTLTTNIALTHCHYLSDNAQETVVLCKFDQTRNKLCTEPLSLMAYDVLLRRILDELKILREVKKKGRNSGGVGEFTLAGNSGRLGSSLKPKIYSKRL